MSGESNNTRRGSARSRTRQQSPVDTLANAEGVELPLLVARNERETTDVTPSGSTTVVSMHDEMITIYHPSRQHGIPPATRPATANNNVGHTNSIQDLDSNNVIAPEPPPTRSYYSLDAYLVPRDNRDGDAESAPSAMFIRNHPQKETYTTRDGYVCYPDMPGR